MVEPIGWVATCVFAASCFCKEPAVLRRVQAGAAVPWNAYGVLLKAPPAIAANLIVAGLAAWSSWRGSASDPA
jgi:hypothetical protein